MYAFIHTHVHTYVYVQAKSDNIDALEKYRDQARPCFLFFAVSLVENALTCNTHHQFLLSFHVIDARCVVCQCVFLAITTITYCMRTIFAGLYFREFHKSTGVHENENVKICTHTVQDWSCGPPFTKLKS